MRWKKKTHFARQKTASGKETTSSTAGSGANKGLREHHGPLTKELRVSQSQLYRWRDELDPGEAEVGRPPRVSEADVWLVWLAVGSVCGLLVIRPELRVRINLQEDANRLMR